jgi:hypothetical protein
VLEAMECPALSGYPSPSPLRNGGVGAHMISEDQLN